MEILREIKKSLKTSINFPCSYIEGNSEKRIYIERCDYLCGEINSEDKKNSKVKANFNY